MRGRDQAAAVAIGVTLATAVLAIGGAPRWAACTVATLGVLSGIPYVTSQRTASKPSPLQILLAIAIGFTAIQVFPLPASVVAILSPGVHELVSDNAAALGHAAPTQLALSYDPPATLVELAKLAGYAAFAFACVRFAASREGRRLLPTYVAGLGALLAAIALAHHAVRAESLFGVFRPEGVRPDFLAPLINENHLAGFLAMTVPVSLGLAVQAERLRRGLWLGAALIAATTCLLTDSRSGALGLGAGLVIATMLYVLQRRSRERDHTRKLPLAVAVPVGVVALCTVVLVGALAAGDVANEIASTTATELEHPRSKLHVWSRATTLLADNRWFGVGRGAFEPAYTRVNPAPEVTFSHVENEYVQIAVDWGVPGAAALGVALILVALAVARRWKAGPVEAGAIGGLVAMATHDVADFALELPGVAMATIALLALLLPPRLATTKAPPKGAIRWRAAGLSAAAITIGLAGSPLGRSARDDEAIVLAMIERGAPAAEIAAAASHAFERHPSDYVLAGRAAQAHLRAHLEARDAARRDGALEPPHNPRPVKLVSRALALNPASAPAHHLAARVLERSQHPAQALVEYGLALVGARDVRPLLDDLLAAFPAPDDAARGMPLDPLSAARILRFLDTPERRAAALAYAARVADHAPDRAAAQSLLARVALAQQRFDLALPAAQRAHTLAPTATTAVHVARATAGAGQGEQALAILADRLGKPSASAFDRLQLLLAQGEIQTDLGHLDAARTTLTAALPLLGNDRMGRISVHRRLATIEDRLGNKNQATWERQQAEALEK